MILKRVWVPHIYKKCFVPILIDVRYHDLPFLKMLRSLLEATLDLTIHDVGTLLGLRGRDFHTLIKNVLLPFVNRYRISQSSSLGSSVLVDTPPDLLMRFPHLYKK